MKVARFYGGSDIRVEEAPQPVPGPGEVLIRVQAAGVCGSDLHGYRRGGPARAPYTAGHELAGEVAALGPHVEGLHVGDRVAVEPLHLIGCGVCRACRQGHYEVCATRGVVDGVRRHSTGFAEYDVAPVANCYRLPDAVSTEAGAILDVYSCGVHAAQRVPVQPWSTVVILGTGPIGLATAEVYRALSARRVVVCGRSPGSVERARPFADAAVDLANAEGAADSGAAALAAATGGVTADIVIEAVGGAAPTLAQALDLVAPGGAVGVLGLFTAPQTIAASQAMQKQVSLVWVNSYGLWDGVPEFRIALEMMAAGRLQPQRMITHRYPLARIAEAFAAADDKRRSGAIKVIVEP